MKKTVRFSENQPTVHLYPDETSTERVPTAHELSIRSRTDPSKNSDSALKSLMASWRYYDVSVVFGNLGRHPRLLNHYLDSCFSDRDDVAVFCDWDLPSVYKTKRVRKADFLIHVEPYFGYTVQKYSFVKHVVILTSHLYLELPETESVQLREFHLLNRNRVGLPDSKLENCEVLVPPVFHSDHPNSFGSEAILLDVSEAKSAHEAYLRLLTGREMVEGKPFEMRMNPRDHDYLKKCLPVLEKSVRRLWADRDWMAKFYWEGYVQA